MTEFVNPPINEKALDKSGMFNHAWMRWFKQQYEQDEQNKASALYGSIAKVIHDYKIRTINSSNQITSVVYKQGGASGTTVATVTINRDSDGYITTATVAGDITGTKTFTRNGSGYVTEEITT